MFPKAELDYNGDIVYLRPFKEEDSYVELA